MEVSIVLITWNSQKFIKPCLDSIFKSVGVQYEVILVDNGSNDDTVKIAKNYDMKIVNNTKNMGVAYARNQGIRIANGQNILILDIDTIIRPDTIKALIEHLNSDRMVGLCAPKLLYSDGALQYSARRFPTIMTKILRRVNTDFAKKVLEKDYYLDKVTKDKPFYVDYVIGACQLIKKEVIDKIGLLDEKIFYGPEDVDYCLRLWNAGYKVLYVPSIDIIHNEQRITKKLFSKVTLLHIKGLIYYFVKHRKRIIKNQ